MQLQGSTAPAATSWCGRCQALAIRWLKLLLKKKEEKIIVTFHYAGVVLSLIPPLVMWPRRWGGVGAEVGVGGWGWVGLLGRGESSTKDEQQFSRGREKERQRGRVGQRGYREDLIVLWHTQNDIIAVRFRGNNNLPSSCVNI